MQTGNLAEGPLHRHTKKISSVAHSRDDNCIVFGFYDHTIWISNVETGDVVVGPLEGHTGGVKSVVFSHDGRHIVSSSDDHTIRICDAETGDIAVGPLEGTPMSTPSHFHITENVSLLVT